MSVRRLLLLSLIIFSYSFRAHAEKSFIKGIAKDYGNQVIRFVVYDDFLTLMEREVAKAKIDSSGNFKVLLDIDFTQPVILKTKFTRSTLYVEPGKNYLLTLPKPSTRSISTIGVLAFVPLAIINSDSLELNHLIGRFENSLDKFYQKNLALIARKGIKKETQNFKMSIAKRFAHCHNLYYKNYINYKIATLEAAGGANKKYIFKNYFLSEIQYNSLEYMQFFNQTFSKYLEELSETKKGVGIENHISKSRSYANLMADILAADSLFKNEELRELFLLKGLNDFYYLPKTNKAAVLTLLNFIKKSGKNNQNQKIAENIIKLLTKMQVGTKAPDFSLIDQNKKPVSLQELKGKFVYLDFWASWCAPCLQELQVKQKLKDKYGKSILFVSISLDNNFYSMKKYLDKNSGLQSIFLYGGDDDNIKESYNIKAIPTYYLLNPEGILIQSPALKPSENIEKLFQSLLKK